MEYRLSDLAFGDLAEIHSYIAQDSPEAARRFIGRLYDKFDFLARFPEAGERRPEFATGDIRVFSAWNYVILLHNPGQVFGNCSCRSGCSQYGVAVQEQRLNGVYNGAAAQYFVRPRRSLSTATKRASNKQFYV